MKKGFKGGAVVAVMLLVAGCTQIDSGNVGVERWLGKVKDTPRPQGVYFTLFKSVDEFTGKEVPLQVTDLTPKARDNLSIKDLDVDVYYRTNPEKIPGLFVKYQGDSARYSSIVKDFNGSDVNIVGYNRVQKAAREAIYTAVADFDAKTMHTKRDELSEAIRFRLQKELDISDKGAFTVTTVNIRNLLTDPGIEEAIRNQVATEIQIERKKKEIVLAQAEADRQIAQAKGEAEANRILSESLTPSLVQIRLAEIEREKVVNSAGKGNTIITGQATPLIQAGSR